MSGHPNQAQYDDGYGAPAAQGHHQQGNTDSYYQDEQAQPYYDQNAGYADERQAGGHPQGGDGYYDESYVQEIFNSRPFD